LKTVITFGVLGFRKSIPNKAYGVSPRNFELTSAFVSSLKHQFILYRQAANKDLIFHYLFRNSDIA